MNAQPDIKNEEPTTLRYSTDPRWPDDLPKPIRVDEDPDARMMRHLLSFPYEVRKNYIISLNTALYKASFQKSSAPRDASLRDATTGGGTFSTDRHIPTGCDKTASSVKNILGHHSMPNHLKNHPTSHHLVSHHLALNNSAAHHPVGHPTTYHPASNNSAAHHPVGHPTTHHLALNNPAAHHPVGMNLSVEKRPSLHIASRRDAPIGINGICIPKYFIIHLTADASLRDATTGGGTFSTDRHIPTGCNKTTSSVINNFGHHSVLNHLKNHLAPHHLASHHPVGHPTTHHPASHFFAAHHPVGMNLSVEMRPSPHIASRRDASIGT